MFQCSDEDDFAEDLGEDEDVLFETMYCRSRRRQIMRRFKDDAPIQGCRRDIIDA